jgi:hypothetical protein
VALGDGEPFGEEGDAVVEFVVDGDFGEVSAGDGWGWGFLAEEGDFADVFLTGEAMPVFSGEIEV